MNRKCYVDGIGAVTTQGIWKVNFFDEVQEVQVPLAFADQPSYKELIPAAMIRRMSKGIKMGIYAAQQALDDAQHPTLDAIITGTGLGCLEDSEKFLRNVLDNDEEFLTPTAFIQSTHNTVGAQIALRLGCKAYNFTYVNGATSFESALLDAFLQIQANEANHVLVGGIDELYGHTFALKELVGQVKKNPGESLRNAVSAGTNFGEQATFLTLTPDKTATVYAEVVDVTFQNQLDQSALTSFVTEFLARHALAPSAISLIVTGRNGDVQFDCWYDDFAALFVESGEAVYKNCVGHSDIASAFGLITAATMLKNQHVPAILKWRACKQKPLKNVLLYNQYLGRDHSLTLLRYVEA